MRKKTRTKLHYKLHTVPPLAATTAPPRRAKKEKGEKETRKEKERVTNPREARDKGGIWQIIWPEHTTRRSRPNL